VPISTQEAGHTLRKLHQHLYLCYLFNKALRSYILFGYIICMMYMYVYMLAIGGQTDGPNWLKSFQGTNEPWE